LRVEGLWFRVCSLGFGLKGVQGSVVSVRVSGFVF
jgi:hypothetical protein